MQGIVLQLVVADRMDCDCQVKLVYRQGRSEYYQETKAVMRNTMRDCIGNLRACECFADFLNGSGSNCKLDSKRLASESQSAQGKQKPELVSTYTVLM